MPEDVGAGATTAIFRMARVVGRTVLTGPGWSRRSVTSPTDPVTDLADRIARLERTMQESRQLSRRLAELVDVVETLLLPMVRLDDAEMQEFLGHYSDTL